MRVNVGLPGPVSVGGNVSAGCGGVIILAVVLPVLCCFGYSIVKYVLGL
jgi:hypothetical protein